MGQAQQLVSEFQEALTLEIEHLKSEGGGARFSAADGRLVGQTGDLFLYRFRLESPLFGSIDDSPVDVRAGQQTARGHVVSSTGSDIILALDTNLGDFIGQAVITVAPYYLLELLRDRLGKIEEARFSLALKAIGAASFSTHTSQPRSITSSPMPNLRQQQAILKCLDSEVGVVWGPPGTGKTTTLGILIHELIREGKSVLLVANTNVATDRAILAVVDGLRGGQLHQAGGILRLGTPSLPIVLNDAHVNLDSVVERLGASIRAEIAATSGELANIEAERHRLGRLLEEWSSVRALAKAAVEASNSIRGIDVEIETLVRTRGRLSSTQTKLETRLQKALAAPALLRFLRRLDPERIQRELATNEQRRTDTEESIGRLDEEKGQHRETITRSDSSRALFEQALRASNLTEDSLQAEVQKSDSLQSQLDEKLKTLAERLSALKREIVSDARLIATTLTRAYTMEEVASRTYDVLVCDEASMAPIPMLFAAASLCRERIVIGGDPRQLAPIATSDAALVGKWLRRDVFQVGGYDKARPQGTSGPVVMLNEQYRMHPQISHVVSELAYNGELLDHANNAYDWIASEPCPGSAIAIYDTSGVNPWSNYTSSWSRFNIYSAVLCFRLALRAAERFPPETAPGDEQPQPMVAIITPYRAQARLLQRLISDARLGDRIVADTVHKFQGLEKDVVVFDCVDGPGTGRVSQLLRGELGTDAARLVTVAISRARRKVALVANCEFLERRLGPSDILARCLRLTRSVVPPIVGETVVQGFFDDDVQRLEGSLRISLDEIKSERGAQYFTEADFFPAVNADLTRATASITVFSPFITTRRSSQFIALFSRKAAQGVRLRVYTRPPNEQGSGMAETAREAISALESAGVDVTFRSRSHEKLVFVDDSVIWFGSLNVLSHRDTSEHMMRLPFRQFTLEVMRLYGLAPVSPEDTALGPGVCVIYTDTFPPKRCSCGSTMELVRQGQFGPFYRCPSCRKTSSVTASELAQVELTIQDSFECGNCNSAMRLRSGRRGLFLGCTSYPECHFTRSVVLEDRRPAAKARTIGPAVMREPRKPGAAEYPTFSDSDITEFEREVARGSPIPEEYSQAHPFFIQAEDLERAGAPSSQVEAILEEARKADEDAYKIYMLRKAIQRRVRGKS